MSHLSKEFIKCRLDNFPMGFILFYVNLSICEKKMPLMCGKSFNVWLISGLTVAKQFALCQHQMHYIITLMSSSQFPGFYIKYITLLLKCRFYSFLVFTSNTLHCHFNVVFTVSWFSHQIITLLL